MLILPVGLEKSEGRRIPWVSAGLIVSCCLVQIVLATSFGDDKAQTQYDLQEAVEYLARRPYLSLPPDLQSLLSDEGLEALEQVRADWRASGAVVAPEAAVREQVKSPFCVPGEVLG